MRVVSLVPSATEILFAVGAGDDVVGVTFECDHPAEARMRTVVSNTTLPEGLSPREIDDAVTAAVARGEDLYRLDAGALSALDADLVVTQDLCAVCALDVATVDAALAHLGCTAEVVTVDPHTLEEVLASIGTIGAAVGRAEAAQALVTSLRERLGRVAEQVAGRPRPRVVVLEWTDPPYAPGHWVPELVEAAGGEAVLGTAGARSHRVTWDDVAAARPEVVVVAPCGFDRAGAREQADALIAQGVLPARVATHAVDADGQWARPGPRLVEGVEELARLLHPHARRDPRRGSSVTSAVPTAGAAGVLRVRQARESADADADEVDQG
ncbi:cobalamin-binding protein [Phycicoccus sonneratiae]|uniref:Cobalamin-binding protein n=1 Tax=Phycicoccus sonneratiae TaxID=2807628 RepID=A0ABS2CK86_9MICO|nr:cobalamin-binding protein [Phycicoccus sonneraticus]MBM6400287.1 cobalamin-binding protein [Phycicoccus sonneraticus]